VTTAQGSSSMVKPGGKRGIRTFSLICSTGPRKTERNFKASRQGRKLELPKREGYGTLTILRKTHEKKKPQQSGEKQKKRGGRKTRR